MKKLIIPILTITVIALVLIVGTIAIRQSSANRQDAISQRIYAQAALEQAESNARYDNAMASVLLVNGMMIPGLVTLAVVGVIALLVYLSIRNNVKPPPVVMYFPAGRTVEQLPTHAPFIIPVEQHEATNQHRSLVD